METGSSFSPADLAAVTGGSEGFGGNAMWIFALLILLFGGGGFGFGGNRATTGFNDYELGQLAGNNATKDNQMALSNQINTTSCNTDSTIHGVATNLGNGISSLGYESLRNFNTTQQAIADCCCSTKQAMGELKYDLGTQSAQTRYDMANFASSINANTTAQTQKILDALCTNKTEALQNQLNNLQLQNAMSNVVRYPIPAYIPNSTSLYGGCNYCN